MLLQLSYLFALHTDQAKCAVLFSFKSTEFVFYFSSTSCLRRFLCNRKFRKTLFELKSSNRLLNNTAQTTSEVSLNSLTHLSNRLKEFGIKFQIKKKDVIKSFTKNFTLNVNVSCMFMT